MEWEGRSVGGRARELRRRNWRESSRDGIGREADGECREFGMVREQRGRGGRTGITACIQRYSGSEFSEEGRRRGMGAMT